MSDANVAVTYSLIYGFLKQQSQTKAADAVKKAARSVIVLKDDFKLEGPPLDEIVKQWKESHAKDSSSDSDSSDDSSDDSSSSSSSDSSSSSSDSTSGDEEDSSSSESESDSNRGTLACKKVSETSCGDRDTSATLSSDAKVPEVKSQVTKKKPSVVGSSSSSSGSDSDSDDSSTDSASDKKPALKNAPKKDGDSSDSDSSSDSSSSSSESESTSSSESTTSSSESESEPEIPPITGKIPVKRDPASSKFKANTGVASIPKEELQVMKKRKTSESGAAVVTAVVSIPPTDDVRVSVKDRNTQKNGKLPRNVNERFSRIKPQTIPPEQLLDNGYEAKGGITNDYGIRAHQDLIVTRGAGFRKEKNKKKRGSYRGGEITLQSHSIKFTD